MNSKHILITGASGLIGTRLTELLLQKGYTVSHLGRTKKEGPVKSFTWDVDHFVIEPGAFKGVDTIIHLAGAGIADKPWTKRRKQVILDSRARSTALLYQELGRPGTTVRSFISASAMGYYGMHDDDRLFIETDAPGNDFLAAVTSQWEEEIDKISSRGIRVVKLRISVVLSDRGGALESLSKPVRLYAGAVLGSGNQYVSWIHLDDMCNMFIKAVEDERMEGAYNAVAPTPVTNREMTRAIAAALHKPLILPAVPGFALKLLLGEMASMILKGSRLSSDKIQKTGFHFKYDTLPKALADLLGRQ